MSNAASSPESTRVNQNLLLDNFKDTLRKRKRLAEKSIKKLNHYGSSHLNEQPAAAKAESPKKKVPLNLDFSPKNKPSKNKKDEIVKEGHVWQ